MRKIFEGVLIALISIAPLLCLSACNGSGDLEAPPNGEENGGGENGNGEDDNGDGDNGDGDNGDGQNGEDDNGDDGDDDEGLKGRLETLEGETVLRVWGDAAERGYAEGALLCDQVTTIIEDFVLGHVVANGGFDYEAVRAQALASVDYAPSDLAWMEALIEGMGEHCPAEASVVESPHLEADSGGSRDLELDDLKVANTLSDWACSSFSVWGSASATGEPIHARNLDYMVDAEGSIQRLQVVKLVHAEDRGVRYVSVSWPGMLGCMSCVTDEGSLIMIHDSNGRSPANDSGLVPRQIALREALTASHDSSAPLEAAEAVLQAAPQYRGSNVHFAGVVDDAPFAAVFEYDGDDEHSDGQVTVRTVEDNEGSPQTMTALITTNHFRKRRSPQSCWRYDALAEGLDAAFGVGGVDLEAAHSLIDQVSFDRTLHTLILDHSTGSVHIHVSRETGVSAPQVEPLVIDLESVFDDAL